jgi:protein SCO1/2
VDIGVRNTLIGIAAFISLILGLMVASLTIPGEMTTDEARALGFYRFDEPRLISDFVLTNHTGSPVSLDDLRGRWNILFFGFTTCPDICPTTLSVLSDAIEALESPPRIIMVSVDPERDSPEVLSQYVPAFHPSFVGYTGTFEETVKLAQQLNIAFGKVPGSVLGTYQVSHSASLVLMDPQGRYAGFIKAPHNAQNIQKIIGSL